MITFKIRRAKPPPKLKFIERRYGPEMDRHVEEKTFGESVLIEVSTKPEEYSMRKSNGARRKESMVSHIQTGITNSEEATPQLKSSPCG